MSLKLIIIISAAIIFIIGLGILSIDQWARHCILRKAYGYGPIDPDIEVKLRFMGFDSDRGLGLLYEVKMQSLINTWDTVKTIGRYDVYSFGRDDTGIIGG